SRKELDVKDWHRLLNIINENNIDTIFHFAATSIVIEGHQAPYETVMNNVMGTAGVLEAARRSMSVKRIIVMGTDKEYGEVENADEKAPLAIHSGIYGTSKLASSLLALAYRDEFGLKTTVVRSVNIYGPHDHNLTRIIPKAVYSFIHGQPFTVYVPTGKRGYIFIEDVLNALKIIEQHDELDVINICSKDVLTSDQLAKLIGEVVQKMFGFNPQITYVRSPYPEIKNQSLVCDKLKSLGWEQKYSITEGLEITIKGLIEYFTKTD
ncbi:MAG: GDP-mannose 4,6-dehydratase, partial [Acidianus infernus]|nr:GDP-mannose 4,6-dehydratase [Acidianus infernus]